MRILVVTLETPTPISGAGKRNFHLLRALMRVHTVTLLIVTGNEEQARSDARPLSELVEALHIVPIIGGARFKRLFQVTAPLLGQASLMQRFSPPSVGRVINRLVAEGRFDAVYFANVFAAGHHIPAGPRVIIDEHNLEYEIMERSAAQATSLPRRVHYAQEATALRKAELAILARSDLISVTSDRERQVLNKLLPDANVRVIPNGVDTEAFAPELQRAQIPGRVVFTGVMGYYPNEQGAHFFANQCWPLIREQIPEATWYLVGTRPPASFQRLADMPGITITGTVPETQSYLAEAEVAIAPLLVGGGTRLKILEALSMGKAVVSTMIGYEGLDLIPEEHLLVADEPGAFADAVTRLLRDADLRARLGAAGRAAVLERYSWASSERKMIEAIAPLAEREGKCDVALADG